MSQPNTLVCDIPSCGKIRLYVCRNCDHCKDCCECPNREIASPYENPILKLAAVQEMGHRDTSFGILLYIKIRRYDYKPMNWSEVQAVFNDRYPGQWAMQFHPPAEDVVDEENIYHLYVMDDQPQGVNIKRR